MSEARATMRARFVAEMGHVGIPLVVGFALCQVWLSLCFFAPQLFPQNASVKVYEISLVVSAVSLLPAFVRPKTLRGVAGERSRHPGDGSVRERWNAYDSLLLGGLDDRYAASALRGGFDWLGVGVAVRCMVSSVLQSR